jgi:hypothetical protein
MLVLKVINGSIRGHVLFATDEPDGKQTGVEEKNPWNCTADGLLFSWRPVAILPPMARAEVRRTRFVLSPYNGPFTPWQAVKQFLTASMVQKIATATSSNWTGRGEGPTVGEVWQFLGDFFQMQPLTLFQESYGLPTFIQSCPSATCGLTKIRH